MPRLASLAAAATCLALAVSALSPQVAEGVWRWPVRGEVAGAFAFSPRAPYAAGQRRGIDIAARPGAGVLAPCPGRVTFAGRVPAGARGITLRCGRLAVTLLGLARTGVDRGAKIAAGAAVGIAGRAGLVRLGARVASRRHGYLDPLALLGAEPLPRDGPGPLGPAPRASPGGRPRPAPARGPAVVARVPSREPGPSPGEVPLAGWAGLAAIAAGLPLGSLLQRRRRRAASRRHRLAGDPR